MYFIVWHCVLLLQLICYCTVLVADKLTSIPVIIIDHVYVIIFMYFASCCMGNETKYLCFMCIKRTLICAQWVGCTDYVNYGMGGAFKVALALYFKILYDTFSLYYNNYNFINI